MQLPKTTPSSTVYLFKLKLLQMNHLANVLYSEFISQLVDEVSYSKTVPDLSIINDHSVLCLQVYQDLLKLVLELVLKVQEMVLEVLEVTPELLHVVLDVLEVREAFDLQIAPEVRWYLLAPVVLVVLEMLADKEVEVES